jgi:hypothetical protein
MRRNMNTTAFWDVAPCSLETDRRFRGAYCLMVEAKSTSEASMNFYETTRRKISEESHLHTRSRENLKYHWEPIVLNRLSLRLRISRAINVNPPESFNP